MILVWLILIPVVGGVLAWLQERSYPGRARWVALGALGLDLGLAVVLWGRHAGEATLGAHGPWLVLVDLPWIPQLGASLLLGLDGLSLVLILLTTVLGVAAVAASWTEIVERAGFFYFNLLWVLAGILGVFLALDLFLFYFFWEMMLVPMYFLIVIWGHEQRVYAAMKFFLFTQLSGLLMLVAILALYFLHGQATGVYTFSYLQLLGTPMAASTAGWLLLGFLAAFAVKLPAVPLHTWLPDAHTEAPTAGSVILAGLLLKTGAYGLLRFALPLFPQAAVAVGPAAMALGIVGILYGALMAFAQTDLKRLVAYTSVSHMGFVLLGIFVWNDAALQGAVLQMVAHGLSTGALFILVGALQERLHTRDLRRMGGLWTAMPRMGGVAMFLAMASLGLPGLANFVGEFLVLLGTYRASVPLAVVATLGLVGATVYSLWMIQAAFHGRAEAGGRPPDFGRREMTLMAAIIALIVWLGLYPQPVLNTAGPALDRLELAAAARPSAAATALINRSGADGSVASGRDAP